MPTPTTLPTTLLFNAVLLAAALIIFTITTYRVLRYRAVLADSTAGHNAPTVTVESPDPNKIACRYCGAVNRAEFFFCKRCVEPLTPAHTAE